MNHFFIFVSLLGSLPCLPSLLVFALLLAASILGLSTESRMMWQTSAPFSSVLVVLWLLAAQVTSPRVASATTAAALTLFTSFSPSLAAAVGLTKCTASLSTSRLARKSMLVILLPSLLNLCPIDAAF